MVMLGGKCCDCQPDDPCMHYIDLKTKGNYTFDFSTMSYVWSDTNWNTHSSVSYVSGYEPPTGNTVPPNTTIKLLINIPCSNYQFGLGIAKTSISTSIDDTTKGVRVKVGNYCQAWHNLPWASSSEIEGWPAGSFGAGWTTNAGHCVEYSGAYAFTEMNLSFGEYDAFGSAFATTVMLGDSLGNGIDGKTLYDNPDAGLYDIPTNHLKVCTGRIPSFPAGARTIPVTIETNDDEIEIYNAYLWHGSQHAFKSDLKEQHILRDVYVVNDAPTSTLTNVNTPTVASATQPAQYNASETVTLTVDIDHSYREGSHNWKTYRDIYMPHRLQVQGGPDDIDANNGEHDWQVSETAPEATAAELAELEDIKDFYLDWENFTHDAVMKDPYLYYYEEPIARTPLTFTLSGNNDPIGTINNNNFDSTTSHDEFQPISAGLMYQSSLFWSTFGVNFGGSWTVSLLAVERGFAHNGANDDWIPYGDVERDERWQQFLRNCDQPSRGKAAILWPLERTSSRNFNDLAEVYRSEAIDQAVDNVPNYLATTTLTKSNYLNSYTFSTSWTQRRVDTFIDYGLIDQTSTYAQNCNWFQDNGFGATSPWIQSATMDLWGVRRTSTEGLPALKESTFAVSSASLGGTDYSAISQCKFFQGDVTASPLSNYAQHKVIANSERCGTGFVTKRYTNNRNLLSMQNGDTEVFKIGFADQLYNLPDLDVILPDNTVYSFDASALYATMANSGHESIGPASVTLTNGSDSISLEVRH